MADKLKWCFREKRGIKLVKPNKTLAGEYINSAEETLVVLKNIRERSNMWLATTKYYCEYFAVYALMVRMGIKSEIHDCTIEIARFLEREGILPKGTGKLLENDKELRIDNQYYLRNRRVTVDFNKLRDFILTIKERVNSLSNERIHDVREKLKKRLEA